MAPSNRLGVLHIIVLSLFWSMCSGQLAFHTDSHTNSFTLKAPGLQQTFTRYFGGQNGNVLNQAQTAGQQPQQDAANDAYQQQFDQINNQNLLHKQPGQYLQQQQHPKKQTQSPPEHYFQQHQVRQQIQQPQPLQQVQQQQQISTREFAAFLQKAQYQQQRKQAAPQGYAEQQAHAVVLKPQATLAANNLLGVAYSPSNQVSHVNFSSGGLAYNF